MQSDGAAFAKDTSNDKTKWMKDIPNYRPLSRINFPGSFNSLSYLGESLYNNYTGIDLFLMT
jgi:hypothetical protein